VWRRILHAVETLLAGPLAQLTDAELRAAQLRVSDPETQPNLADTIPGGIAKRVGCDERAVRAIAAARGKGWKIEKPAPSSRSARGASIATRYLPRYRM
jgi:hypothetical protein